MSSFKRRLPSPNTPKTSLFQSKSKQKGDSNAFFGTQKIQRKEEAASGKQNEDIKEEALQKKRDMPVLKQEENQEEKAVQAKSNDNEVVEETKLPD